MGDKRRCIWLGLAIATLASCGPHRTRLPNLDREWPPALSDTSGVPITIACSNLTTRSIPELDAFADELKAALRDRGRALVDAPMATSPVIVDLIAKPADTRARLSASINGRQWFDQPAASEATPAKWTWTGLRLSLASSPNALVGVLHQRRPWLVFTDDDGIHAQSVHPVAERGVRRFAERSWPVVSADPQLQVTARLSREQRAVVSLHVDPSANATIGVVHAGLPARAIDWVRLDGDDLIRVTDDARSEPDWVRVDEGGFRLRRPRFLHEHVLQSAQPIGGDRAVVAVTLDGRVVIGDARGEWEAPRAGYAVGVVVIGRYVIAAREADEAGPGHLTVWRLVGRRLVEDDEIVVGSRIVGLTALDINGDTVDELVVATEHGSGAMVTAYREGR